MIKLTINMRKWDSQARYQEPGIYFIRRADGGSFGAD